MLIDTHSCLKGHEGSKSFKQQQTVNFLNQMNLQTYSKRIIKEVKYSAHKHISQQRFVLSFKHTDLKAVQNISFHSQIKCLH